MGNSPREHDGTAEPLVERSEGTARAIEMLRAAAQTICALRAELGQALGTRPPTLTTDDIQKNLAAQLQLLRDLPNRVRPYLDGETSSNALQLLDAWAVLAEEAAGRGDGDLPYFSIETILPERELERIIADLERIAHG